MKFIIPGLSLFFSGMGVVVPEIESSKVKKDLAERGYGVLGTSAVIDETASAFGELIYEIVRGPLATEIETTMKRLLTETGSTKRRVNALRVQVIPELGGSLSIHQNAA